MLFNDGFKSGWRDSNPRPPAPHAYLSLFLIYQKPLKFALNALFMFFAIVF